MPKYYKTKRGGCHCIATRTILRRFPALKSYILTLGDNCPVALGKYFYDNHAKKTCFLGFLDNALSCETYILTDLRLNVEQRLTTNSLDLFVQFPHQFHN